MSLAIGNDYVETRKGEAICLDQRYGFAFAAAHPVESRQVEIIAYRAALWLRGPANRLTDIVYGKRGHRRTWLSG